MNDDDVAVREIHGRLYAYFETGTEGVVWSIIEDGKDGYDALNCLEAGDKLIVFEDDGKAIWDGVVNLEYELHRQPHEYNPSYLQQTTLGYWVRGLQTDVNPEFWGKMFFDAKKAVMKRKVTQP